MALRPTFVLFNVKPLNHFFLRNTFCYCQCKNIKEDTKRKKMFPLKKIKCIESIILKQKTVVRKMFYKTFTVCKKRS